LRSERLERINNFERNKFGGEKREKRREKILEGDEEILREDEG